ncbi:aldo/keto reductase [Purpureocillium lavendulum]|uniref:Aldo/keto reductase n=1 Tax=Purpureocillium lavendulum TaxID=1247861 RepID=A0AB34G8N7_9HYPO|nr:aldo/keto reductase [Purpureocillium lavendulum]
MPEAQYTIQVTNSTGQIHDYLFLTEAPQSQGLPGIQEIYASIWDRKAHVPINEHRTFAVQFTDYAVSGTAMKALANGVSIATSSFVAVETNRKGLKPGTIASLETVPGENGRPQFTKSFGKTTKDNAFGISTKNFKSSGTKSYFCGYGKKNQHGEVVPVCTWVPSGGMTYEIAPVLTYYVGTGPQVPGTVVDPSKMGQVAKIDFSTAPAGQTVATVIHNADGTFSPPVYTEPVENQP